MKKLRFFGMFFVVLVLFVVPTYLSYGQDEPIEEWVARYNGPANSYDLAWAIALDSSGNVYVTGRSYGSGTEHDYATVKYDTDGTQLWIKRYNGPGNSTDQPYAIAVDSLDNVYVTGESYGGIGTGYDYATVKYDTDGTQLWIKRYNGLGNSVDQAYAIAVDSLDNVYVTGQSYGGIGTRYDYATVKYDTDGTQLWVARYNGLANNTDQARAIAVDSLYNVYVLGRSYVSGTDYDYATVKYDTDGTQLWVRWYNDPENGGDIARAIAVDSSDNVYVTGYSYASGSYLDYATIKYGPDGTQLWVARYNGPGNSVDHAKTIAVDSLDNVYVTGESYSIGTGYDYATVKYDTDGTQLWVKSYNNPGNYSDVARAIAVDSSDNVYVTGVSYAIDASYDYATVKYDTDGTELWVVIYNGPGNSYDNANAMAVDSLDNVYVTGWSYDSGTDYDYTTVKYSQKRTPEEQIEEIKIDVDMHYSEDDISTGKYKGMKRKLNDALKALERGNERVACNKLHDFIDQVNAAINSDPLTQEEGQVLIDAANELINELCG